MFLHMEVEGVRETVVIPDVEALPCQYESGLQSPPPGIHTEFIPGTKSEYSNAHNMIMNNGFLQWEPDVCTL
jgi:hypothetical protein